MAASNHLQNLEYLQNLAKEYPNRAAVGNEIINLEAILKLPKGTEHFMSDIHGEYEAFTHILNNASGVVREKVDAALGNTLSAGEKASLSTLIYYPAEKLSEVKRSGQDMQAWYSQVLYRLVQVCHHVASKSTRKFVRRSLPKGYEYVIDELLQAHFEEENKQAYYEQLVQSIIATDLADHYIAALAKLIKELAVYRLHIVGDIFDRGPRPDVIMDMLCAHHSVDVQWGNHDILWMGAAAGSDLCIANVLTIALKYRNTDMLKDGYNIDLRPLEEFAAKTYSGVNCSLFVPRETNQENKDIAQTALIAQMHKAVTVIMFKLECQFVTRNEDFGMAGRCVLPRVNFLAGTVEINGVDYPLKDCDFPTVDPADPTALTEEELTLVRSLRKSFTGSERLARHTAFLYEKGSIYKIENNVLMLHGALPMEGNGTFTKVTFGEKQYAGKRLIEYCETMARQAYFAPPASKERQRGLDFMWYLWSGPKSPLFGKDKMATFERLLIADKNTHTERKDDYYRYTDSETVAKIVLEEFGLDPAKSHIVHGHIPVKASRGESPIKAGGRVIMIDGGFSKAYQPTTGIAGYTMVYTSRGISLRSHAAFESLEKAVRENQDIHSTVYVFEHHKARLLIKDTDEGARIEDELKALYQLAKAYETGALPEGDFQQLQKVLEI